MWQGLRVRLYGCIMVANRHFIFRGSERKYPPTNFSPREHRARVDGRATARHLHGIIERAVRCDTVKVSAESSGAVASNVFFESLTTRQKVADSHNLMVVLAHLQGVAATFSICPLMCTPTVQ